MRLTTEALLAIRCLSRLCRLRAKWSVASIALLFVCSPHALGRSRIWIDTDPSIGAPYREVDDAYALVLAFGSPEVQITGISTTYGNAGVNRTTSVARDLVRRFGRPAHLSESDIHPGAANPRDRNRSTAATDALSRALPRARMTYVALGPLTNLATVLSLHPELASRLERVIFVGGQTSSRAIAFGPHAWRIHDANVSKDPEAVSAVLRAGIPITLVAPEVAGRLVHTRDDARQLASTSAAGLFLQRKSRVWLWFWTAIVKHPGGALFDSLGIVQAARPDLVPTERRYAAVNARGELIVSRGRVTGGRLVTFCNQVTAAANGFARAGLLRGAAANPSPRGLPAARADQ